MNEIKLHPLDVLFFRDGRPMEAASRGIGSVFPPPHVFNGALHAALHRGFPESDDASEFEHRHGNSKTGQRSERFGSLLSAGPFPVASFEKGSLTAQWHFPAPADLEGSASPTPAFLPLKTVRGQNSLPPPLLNPVARRLPPKKEKTPLPWLSQTDFRAYLENAEAIPGFGPRKSADFFTAEAAIGIAIDPETQTTETGKFYSAEYLRLRPECCLGAYAEMPHPHKANSPDGIDALFCEAGKIVVGGQMRVCSVESNLPEGPLHLPVAPNRFLPLAGEEAFGLKWVLLSPSVFPKIEVGNGRQGTPHPGGWLPNWIAAENNPDAGVHAGDVLLRAGDTSRSKGERRDAWRKRVRDLPPLKARLVAAFVPKPLTLSGWALDEREGHRQAGAKSTLLAVPAGAVYYFKTPTEEDARSLADALNWHGATPGTEIRNRRSTLLGEKGYGLGLCGTWQYS